MDLDGLEPAYPKPDGTYTTARDGQMEQMDPDPAAIQYYTDNPEAVSANSKELGMIGQSLVDLGCMTLGAVNEIVTGVDVNGNDGNRFTAALNLLPFLITGKESPKGMTKGPMEMPAPKGEVKSIGPAGDPGGTVMKQLPENMQTNMKTTQNGQGTIFKDPKNPGGNNVRVQSGNPASPNPAQQKPYVKQVSNGKTVDVSGKPVDPKSVESHIPKDDFKYKR
jgi:hypothetical protein